MLSAMKRWKNKVAIVTGASAGIGAAVTQQLVDAGLKVVGLVRRKERLDDMTQKFEGSNGEFYGIVCDITKEEDILNAFKLIKNSIGPVHILINNAGISTNTNLIEGDTNVWRKVFDTNVIGLCISTREAVRDMRANMVDGHIIHLNSISGHKIGYKPRVNVYPASKHAVTALTETLRQELKSVESKIKISSISPGVVRTEMRKASGLINTDEELKAYNAEPMLEAKDVANAIMYVLSTPPYVQIHELIIKPLGEWY